MNNGYLSIKNKAVLELKSHLFRTYSYLISKDYNKKGVYYSQATMANELGICVRTLQRHIKELRDLGYLEVKRRGFNMTNLYTMLKHIVVSVKEKAKEMKGNFNNKFSKKRNAFVEDCPERESNTEEYYSQIELKLLGWDRE